MLLLKSSVAVGRIPCPSVPGPGVVAIRSDCHSVHTPLSYLHIPRQPSSLSVDAAKESTNDSKHAIMRKASEALKAGDFTRALTVVAQLLEIDPSNVGALSLKSHAEMGLGRFDLARETSKRIGQIDADSFEFHDTMGVILTDEPPLIKEKRAIRRAIQHFESAIRIAVSERGFSLFSMSGLHYNLANAKHDLYLYRRVTAGYSLRQILDAQADALAEFDIALRHDPDNVEAWVNKGNLLDETGRYIESLDCYLEALQRNPKHSMALGNRGLALALLALRLPRQYQGACLREAGYFFAAALEVGEFSDRRKNDPKLKAVVDFVLGPGGFENAEAVVGHLLEHVRRLQILPEDLGRVRTTDFRGFAQGIVRALGLRLAFAEDFLFRGSESEDWIDLPGFLLTGTEVGAEERIFLVSLIDRYRTARNLLVLSLSHIEPFEVLSGPSREGLPSLSMNEEALKDSLKTAADLLDSVAHFLANHGSYKLERVAFCGSNSIFNKTPIFEDHRENQQLLALASLSWEISRGEYNWLEGFRNARTHEYLFLAPKEGQLEKSLPGKEYHFASVDEFLDRTVRALRIARAAILYTILFVSESHDKVKPSS